MKDEQRDKSTQTEREVKGGRDEEEGVHRCWFAIQFTPMSITTTTVLIGNPTVSRQRGPTSTTQLKILHRVLYQLSLPSAVALISLLIATNVVS